MKIWNNFEKWLWSKRSDRYKLRRLLQILSCMIGHILDDAFRERAQALAYTTLLSLVPLIAVAFSILKGFGVHHQLMPWVKEAFSPLGDRAGEASDTVIGFVENVQVSVLGAVGFAILFYTVVSLLSSIEIAFNRMWDVQKGRNLGRRISDYLVLVLIGPVLMFVVLSVLSGYIMPNVVSYLSPFGLGIMQAFGQSVAILVMTSVIAFLYLFITYHPVRILPALTGGLFSALLWLAVGKIFAHFVATSGNYSTIYSGFASVILFMLWNYITWLILLLGNQLAFYVQYPERLLPEKDNNQLRDVSITLKLKAPETSHQKWTVTQINSVNK